MFYRPHSKHRKNIRGVIYPLTEAVQQVFGSRAQDGARPIGAFYPVRVDNKVWRSLGGIWYEPLDGQALLARSTHSDVIAAFAASIKNGSNVVLPSGITIGWEVIPQSEGSQLPPVLGLMQFRVE